MTLLRMSCDDKDPQARRLAERAEERTLAENIGIQHYHPPARSASRYVFNDSHRSCNADMCNAL